MWESARDEQARGGSVIFLEKTYERCVEICSFKSIMEFGEAQYTVAKKSILLLSIHQQLCLRSSKEIQGSKSVCARVGNHWAGFPLQKGVRRHCVTLPWLFNVFCAWNRQAKENLQGRVGLTSTNLQLLLSADDVVMVIEKKKFRSKLLEQCPKHSLSGQNLKPSSKKKPWPKCSSGQNLKPSSKKKP